MRNVRTLSAIASLVCCELLMAHPIFAQSGTAAGQSTYPLDSLPHDQHEGMRVSVDSYSDVRRAKEKLGKADPVPVGMLPVDVFLTNSTTQPIRIDMESIQLSVHFPNGQRQDIDWLPVSEVARVIAHPNGPSNPHAPRFPVGVQTGADTKTDKVLEVLRPFALDVSIIPPLSTIHGLLFFDLSHDLSLAQHASLYVPNLTSVPEKKPLMFFEVALGGS